jgi:hypothetical protein
LVHEEKRLTNAGFRNITEQPTIHVHSGLEVRIYKAGLRRDRAAERVTHNSQAVEIKMSTEGITGPMLIKPSQFPHGKFDVLDSHRQLPLNVSNRC